MHGEKGEDPAIIETQLSLAVSSKHEPGQGLLSWMAWVMRRAADRLDGGSSLAIKCRLPGFVPERTLGDALHYGLQQTGMMLRTLVDSEAERQGIIIVERQRSER